jgi:hypothetical protein
MNQDVQENTFKELELLCGSVVEIDPPTAQADYPEIDNVAPG